MRHYILSALAAFTLFGFSIVQADVAEAGQKKCPKQHVLSTSNNCVPRKAPKVPVYRGTVHKPAKITVTVCHPYWDDLLEKWWGPALADTGDKKSWIKLQPHRKRCKTQSGFPGFRIGNKASCLGGRWIWTQPIYRSGTYDMTLNN